MRYIPVVPQDGAPELLLANQAGLQMLETTAAKLSELSWTQTIPSEEARTVTLAAMSQAVQQVRHYCHKSVHLLSMPRLRLECD